MNYIGGAFGSGVNRRSAYYCSPSSTACMEDNVGGASAEASLSDTARSTDPIDQAYRHQIGVTVSLLTDAVDGTSRPVLPDGVTDQPSAGGFWREAGGGLLEPQLDARTDAFDEEVILSGAMLRDTLAELAVLGGGLTRERTFTALAHVARRSFSDEQVCAMFALHAPGGMCTELVPWSAIMDFAIPPGRPRIVRSEVDVDNEGHWTWTDGSSSATGFTVELERADGTAVFAPRSVAFARSASLDQPLDYDEAYTFRVAAVNGDSTGPFVESSVHSYAEPVAVLRGTAVRGGAELSWDAVRATDYLVYDVTDGRDVLVGTSATTTFTVRGLTGGVTRRFAIVSRNAVGAPSEASPTVSVTPLEPSVLYVSTSGNDADTDAGAPAHPFRTLRAAALRAVATSADQIRVAAGTYTESTIELGGLVTVRGGYTQSGATWTEGGGATTVRTTGSEAVAGCATSTIDASTLVAGIHVVAGAEIGLVDLTLTTDEDASVAGACLAALAVEDAALRLDGVTIETRATGSCSSGVVALSSDVAAERSVIVGRGAEVVPSGLEASGLVACGGSLALESSTVRAASASSAGASGSVAALVGVSVASARSVRVQRSIIDALAQGPSWHATAGRLTALDASASERIFAANSLFRTPHGGSVNRALDLGSDTGGRLANLQLLHVTAQVGADWDAVEDVTLPFEGAVIALRGAITDVALINDLVVFAGGGHPDVSGTLFTGLDRQATTSDPATLTFLGNVVSVPLHTSGWYVASLAQCHPLQEFGGRIVDQAGLDTASLHACHGGDPGGWSVARNAAFDEPSSSGAARAVVTLEADGYPSEPSRVFLVGEDVSTLAWSSELELDIASERRGSPPGVGAWRRR